MVRNSTKRASTAAAASSTTTPSSTRSGAASSTTRGRASAAASSTTTASTPSAATVAPPVVLQITEESNGVKSFVCPGCSLKVKFDADKSPEDHKCDSKLIHQRLRKRLRGPPPYQYSNEEAAVGLPPIKKRGKKAAFVSLNEKKAVDAEKEAWLQREVVNKVYDPKDIWCRYCGCVQASGFSRGPWGSRKLCTIHYVQWQTKKSLDLSKWPKEPTEPINRMENTEFDYLRRMQAKGAKLEAESSA